MESQSHPNDIPIWWNGTQRWMTGLTKRTTCDDVIYALLYSNGLHETDSTDNYAIFEKWREVERPLSARTKLLKVWTFWGQEQASVKLSMRSLDDYFLPGESSLYLQSKRSRHRRPSRHKSRHTNHERCLTKRGCVECSRLRSLEQLVKLVVSQERKIQDLSDRIHRTDRQVDNHEAKIHQHRVEQNGLDYVQNSYLNSHSSSSNSSIDSSTFTTIDLKKVKAIFPDSSWHELEEIIRMCDDLTHIEQRMGREQSKVNELTPEVNEKMHEMGMAEQQEQETNGEIEEVKVQMVRALTSHITNEYKEKELDRKAFAVQSQLEAKMDLLRDLQCQLSEIDRHMNQKKTDTFPTIDEKGTYPYSEGIHPLCTHASLSQSQHQSKGDIQTDDMHNDIRHRNSHFTHPEYHNLGWHRNPNNKVTEEESILKPDDDYRNQNTFLRDTIQGLSRERGHDSKPFNPSTNNSYPSKYDKDVMVNDVTEKESLIIVGDGNRNRGKQRRGGRRGSGVRSRSEERARPSGVISGLCHSGHTTNELRSAIGWDEEKGLRYSPAILNQYGLDPARRVPHPNHANGDDAEGREPWTTTRSQTEKSRPQPQTNEGGARSGINQRTVTDPTLYGEQSRGYNGRNAWANRGGNCDQESKTPPIKQSGYPRPPVNTGPMQSVNVSSPVQTGADIQNAETMQGKKVDGEFERSVRDSSVPHDGGIVNHDSPRTARKWKRSPRNTGMTPGCPNVHGTVLANHSAKTGTEQLEKGNTCSGDSDACTPRGRYPLVNRKEKDILDTAHSFGSERGDGHFSLGEKLINAPNNGKGVRNVTFATTDSNESSTQYMPTTNTSQGQNGGFSGHVSSRPEHRSQTHSIDDSCLSVNGPNQRAPRHDDAIDTPHHQLTSHVHSSVNQNHSSHTPLTHSLSDNQRSPHAMPSINQSNINNCYNKANSNNSNINNGGNESHSFRLMNGDAQNNMSGVAEGSKEAHSSRGALYHIISHKLNKAKPNERAASSFSYHKSGIGSSVSMDNVHVLNGQTTDTSVRNNLRYHNSSSSSCSSSSTTTINASSLSSTETLTPRHPDNSTSRKDDNINYQDRPNASQQSSQHEQINISNNWKGLAAGTSHDTPRPTHQQTSSMDGNTPRSGNKHAWIPNNTNAPQIIPNGILRYAGSSFQSKSTFSNSLDQDLSKSSALSRRGGDQFGNLKPPDGSMAPNYSKNSTLYNTSHPQHLRFDDHFESDSDSYDLAQQNFQTADYASTPRTPRTTDGAVDPHGKLNVLPGHVRNENTTHPSAVSPLLKSAMKQTTDSPVSPGKGNRRRRVNPHFCDIDQGEKNTTDVRKPPEDNTPPTGYDEKNNNSQTRLLQNSVMVTGEEFGNRRVNFASLNDKNRGKSVKGLSSNLSHQIVDVRHIVSNRDALKASTGVIETEIRNTNSYKETITNGHTMVKNKLEDSNDSNSDTGLSSMHSDETANLETLV